MAASDQTANVLTMPRGCASAGNEDGTERERKESVDFRVRPSSRIDDRTEKICLTEGTNVLRGDDQRLVISHFIGQASEFDGVAGRQRARALDGVLQLADVAWPRVAKNLLESVGSIPHHPSAHLIGDSREECVRETTKILRTIPERRDGQFHDFQAVEEILPEPPLRDVQREIPIRGTDDADVELPLAISPTRRTSCSWSARRSLTCSGSGTSPTSSSSNVPRSAASKRPGRSWTAPVNAPRA